MHLACQFVHVKRVLRQAKAVAQEHRLLVVLARSREVGVGGGVARNLVGGGRWRNCRSWITAMLPMHKCTNFGQICGCQFHAAACDADSKHIIGGLQVCQRAFLILTGFLRQSLQRLKVGRYDARSGKRSKSDPRNACNEAFAKIYGHLWHCPLSAFCD